MNPEAKYRDALREIAVRTYFVPANCSPDAITRFAWSIHKIASAAIDEPKGKR